MNKFYIATTLPYINSDPHIGFAMEIIQADVLARYHKLIGDEVFFNTGTDEHGLKIYQKAKEKEVEPKEYADAAVEKFINLKKILNLSWDNFIRTTDEHHIKAATEFWKICDKNGYIYKKNYKVKYCVGCEMEKTDSELENECCPLHPDQELEIINEENYFFRYSAFQEKLSELYKNNPELVKPAKRFNEAKAFVERGLNDFSISRLKEKMPWGIPVPGDETQVMYVWFDALVNYISAIGWPDDLEKFNSWWPGAQLAGKDNLRPQSAMWQAMLMAADLSNSKQIYINGFINVNGQKMSKSLGNVISPEEMVKKFGIDGTRYLLLTSGVFGEDWDVSWGKFIVKYNADLANNLGNLLSRVAKLGDEIDFPRPNYKTEEIFSSVIQFFNDLRLDQVLIYILNIAKKQNESMDKLKIWEMKKNDPENFKKNIITIAGNLFLIADLISPFLPGTSESIKSVLEKKESIMLFPRIK